MSEQLKQSNANNFPDFPEDILWRCQVRLEFLTTLALEEPDLVKHDSMFTGFREVLLDAKELLGLAIEKITKEDSAERSSCNIPLP